MKNRICSFCKKEYEGYPVFLCKDIECFAMEMYLKTIYYSNESNRGICKECRDIHIHNDNIWKARSWFTIRLQLECALIDIKKKNNVSLIKVYEEAIERVKKIIAKAEEDPAVQALYRENNPAAYKEMPSKGTKCSYCEVNKGQVWINDPNGNVKPETCWFVCIPCKKLIELQEEDSFLRFHQHLISEKGLSTERINERIKDVEKKIDEVSYEDGQLSFTMEIKKNENGTVDIKGKKYG